MKPKGKEETSVGLKRAGAVEGPRFSRRVVEHRSLEQNALQHCIFREILNHLISNGVKLPPGERGEEIIKSLCKRAYGPKLTVGGIEIDKSTKYYTTEQTADFITQIIVWAAHDLNLRIET